MRGRNFVAFGWISLLTVGSIAGLYAADPPKSIKEVMANHKKDQLRQQIGDGLKAASPDWDELQMKSKTYAANASKLGNFDPPKGDKENYKKLATSFADTIKDLDKAIQAKDKSAANAAFQKSATSCSACHQAHRGS